MTTDTGAPLTTFLYDNITDQALNPASPRMLLFVGGAATGKSAILQKLFEGQHDPHSVYIQGEDRAAAVEALQRAAKGDKPVFIDDLDDFFDDDVRDLLEQLARIGGPPRIRATSTFPPDLAYLRGRGAFAGVQWSEDLVKSWSDILMGFVTQSVDPWTVGWKRRLFDLVRRAVPEYASGWAVVVLHLTGGQPAMFEAALSYLAALERHAPRTAGDPPSGDEWRRRTDQLEEHLFATGFKRLRRAVAEAAATDPRAGEYLIKVARDDVQDASETDAVRRTLTASGLVYRTANRPFVLAGEILRRHLADEDVTRYPSVRTQGDEERGDIVIVVGTETIAIPLRGKNWQLARVLGRQPGERILLDDLQRESQIEKPAMRSAIQRLKAEIEHAGFDGIVENVWSEGYRLSTFPLMGPYAPD